MSRPANRDLVVVSNRLPIKLRIDGQTWQSTSSSGGLASALAGLREDQSFVWVGWPGGVIPSHLEGEVKSYLGDDRLVPVFLDDAQERDFYHGMCNRVLWPLFHYFVDKVDFHSEQWRHYVDVNQAFADEVVAVAAEGGRVWIHDFHLMLLPRMLREARPDLEIGFFLHIPFPSSEIYRILPVRERLLEGVLGADYIGFHTHDYARHFRAACLRVLGLESDRNALVTEGRRVGIGAHPIGIDTETFENTIDAPATVDLVEQLGARYGDRKLILGVERLDYTKGVLLKLHAFERLLERTSPEARREITMLQVLVPSRLETPEYRTLKREIEEFVGSVNGRYGSPGITPIEYMHRDLTREELVALYRFAHVGMITPVRDGMNLIAQEFVLCQDDRPGARDDAHRGILVLSEFAGAAQSLPRALMVNPWDLDQTASALEQALEMTAAEKRGRMKMMAEIVRHMECNGWAAKFLRRLSECTQEISAHALPAEITDDVWHELVADFASAENRVLFLDYDGTLTDLVRTPEDAVPSAALLELLTEISELDGETHIVSGRSRADLEAWLGHLPVHLVAEHGMATRVPGGGWHEEDYVDLDWVPTVAEILEDVTDEVPGTRLERKPGALAWHYRTADLDYGAWRARELHSQLQDDLAHLPVEILHGHRVLEVRAAGVNKGRHVERTLERLASPEFVMCIGDDRTDEDMYRALPDDAVAINVGGAAEGVRCYLKSPQQVRALLMDMVHQAHHQSSGAR